MKKLGLEEWLIQVVMALYSEASTMATTCTGDSRSFEVKLRLQQCSVLSSLLLSMAMGVVTKEAKLSLELLYADDLIVSMASEDKFVYQRTERGCREYKIVCGGVGGTVTLGVWPSECVAKMFPIS